MQKKIIALAIASAFVAPVAMAESSFYGSMDGGVRMQTFDDGTNPSTTTFSMKMGQYNTSRWGFKGVDDIGGGVKANVVVETSFVPAGVGANSDMNSASYMKNATYASGTHPDIADNNPFGLIFDRQATVGMESSTLGRFDMGWNYTASHDVIGTYDPMNYKFINTALAYSAADRARAGNVKYQIDVSGVHIIAEYDINDEFGGAVSTSGSNRAAKTGTGRAFGATYAAGGLNVGAAYTTTDGDLIIGNYLSPNNKSTHFTVGGGYSFGDAKVSVGYAKKTMKFENYTNGNDAIQTDMWLGGSYNVSSKATVSAAYYTRAFNDAMQSIGAFMNNSSGGVNQIPGGTADLKTNVVMVMMTYSMSKMTTLYAEYDNQDLKDGMNSSGQGFKSKVSGFSAGLDVKF